MMYVLIIYGKICHDVTLIKHKYAYFVVPKLSCKSIFNYRIFAKISGYNKKKKF